MNKREHSRCYTTRQRRKPHLKHSLIEQPCLCFLKRKHLVTNLVSFCDITRNYTESNLLQVQQNPFKGVLRSDMYTIPGKLYTSGEYVKQLCIPIGESDLKNHMGLILGNHVGVNLGITPHPPVLIRRSESTLPLVVMAVNNPLLL
jgi:hypothetical protein